MNFDPNLIRNFSIIAHIRFGSNPTESEHRES